MMKSNVGNYDKMLYESTIVDVDSYIRSKLDDIHAKIFMDALEAMFNATLKFNENYEEDTLDEFLDDFRMKEIKADEYFKPSNIVFYEKKFPYRRIDVDLTPWWNDFQAQIVDKDLDDKMIDEEDKTYGEAIYVDYINGKTKIRNRMTGKEFWVSNEYVKNLIDNDKMLGNTFGHMLKNMI